MRVFALPLALLVACLIVALLVVAFRRPPDRRTRWEAATELRDDVTVVLVRRLAGDREVERQVVAEVPAGAPDWEDRYHEAMARARSRAAALESETG